MLLDVFLDYLYQPVHFGGIPSGGSTQAEVLVLNFKVSVLSLKFISKKILTSTLSVIEKARQIGNVCKYGRVPL